jgi:hypothetical protein
MLGSQALETAIGLTLMFFVISLAASTLVETYSRLTSKRAADLERTLGLMLAGGAGQAQAADALTALKATTVYDAVNAAAGTSAFRNRPKRPSYLSAKSFADAVLEIAFTDRGSLVSVEQLPPGLARRLSAVVRETQGDLVSIKAGLEHWFDETMERLCGSYKRWATALIFGAGVLIAVGVNASTFDVAQKLWHDPATREIVVTSAGSVASGTPVPPLPDVARTADQLTQFGLPVGWDDHATSAWGSSGAWPTRLASVAGWLVTGLLVSLGAPFWFDLLGRLVSLRSTGGRPSPAATDPSSATSRRRAETAEPLPAGVGVAAVPGRQQGPAPSPSPDPGDVHVDARLRAAFGLPAWEADPEGDTTPGPQDGAQDIDQLPRQETEEVAVGDASLADPAVGKDH